MLIARLTKNQKQRHLIKKSLNNDISLQKYGSSNFIARGNAELCDRSGNAQKNRHPPIERIKNKKFALAE
jgi:hypothetical protein